MGLPVEKLRHIDPSLKDAATIIEEQIAAFGVACENLVLKYAKSIEDQQILLRRLADCAMELYAMASVTSRAGRAFTKNSSSAAHEVLLANTYCKEARVKISQNLKALTNNSDRGIQELADQIFKAENYIPNHPLGM